MIFEVNIQGECNFCTRKQLPTTTLKSAHPDRRMQIEVCAFCLGDIDKFCRGMNPPPSDSARHVALEPCPFCGGDPILTIEGVAGDRITEPYHVRCMRCDIKVTRPSRDEAIAAWNRRARRQGGEAVAWQYRMQLKGREFWGEWTSVESEDQAQRIVAACKDQEYVAEYRALTALPTPPAQTEDTP